MEKLTGLWRNQSKNGKTYYSGKVGNTRFLLFKNDKNGNDENAPDLTLHIGKVNDDEEWTVIPQHTLPGVTQAARKAVQNPPKDFDELDDSIPF